MKCSLISLPSPVHRACSSVTASCDLEEADDTIRTRRSTRERTINLSPEIANHLHSASPDPLGNDGNSCGICLSNECTNSAGEFSWVACDRCNSWFHITCLLSQKAKKRMLLATPKGMKQAVFHCQLCVLGPDHFTQEVSVELNNFLDVAAQLKKNRNHPNTNSDRPIINSFRNLQQQNEILKGRCQALEHENDQLKAEREELNFRLERTEEIGLVMESSYPRYEPETVEKYLRDLRNSVNDYARSIWQRVETSEKAFSHPFADWHSIDLETSSFGQPWFSGDSKSAAPRHTILTAALRGMLKIRNGEPLRIDPRLEGLEFTQVHKSFVWWFIFDVVFHLDIDFFPTMKVVQAMASAVRGFAFARKLMLLIHYVKSLKSSRVAETGSSCRERSADEGMA